jgi:N,N-dimethylformamidase
VGSITFCGSLSYNRYDNNVSRILRNVLDRFRAGGA